MMSFTDYSDFLRRQKAYEDAKLAYLQFFSELFQSEPGILAEEFKVYPEAFLKKLVNTSNGDAGLNLARDIARAELERRAFEEEASQASKTSRRRL